MNARLSVKIKKLKPWDKLGISRHIYDQKKPWKKANLSREKFEELIELLPDHFITEVKREAEAEHLVKTIFGEV